MSIDACLRVLSAIPGWQPSGERMRFTSPPLGEVHSDVKAYLEEALPARTIECGTLTILSPQDVEFETSSLMPSAALICWGYLAIARDSGGNVCAVNLKTGEVLAFGPGDVPEQLAGADIPSQLWELAKGAYSSLNEFFVEVVEPTAR